MATLRLDKPIAWIDGPLRRLSRGVTVIDFDGVMLRLVAARPGPDGEPLLAAHTQLEVDAAAPWDALATIAEAYRAQLRQAGWKPPRRNVLVTAQAVQGLVRIPVPP